MIGTSPCWGAVRADVNGLNMRPVGTCILGITGIMIGTSPCWGAVRADVNGLNTRPVGTCTLGIMGIMIGTSTCWGAVRALSCYCAIVRCFISISLLGVIRVRGG